MTKFIASIAAIIATAGFFLGMTDTAQAASDRPTVRDHRSKPIVRDHRKPNFCFGAITGTNCYRF